MAKRIKKVEDIIKEVEALDAPVIEKAEAIKELEDLIPKPEEKKVFAGFNPITGEEVWQ